MGVAPETFLTTDKGQIPIGTLEGKTVRVWNGQEWSKTVVQRIPGEDVELIQVRMTSGAFINCTPDHQFILKDGVTRIDAGNLISYTKLCEWELEKIPVIQTMVKEVVRTFIVNDMEITLRSPTFMVNEPHRRSAVFNGVLTGITLVCKVREH